MKTLHWLFRTQCQSPRNTNFKHFTPARGVAALVSFAVLLHWVAPRWQPSSLLHFELLGHTVTHPWQHGASLAWKRFVHGNMTQFEVKMCAWSARCRTMLQSMATSLGKKIGKMQSIFQSSFRYVHHNNTNNYKARHAVPRLSKSKHSICLS